MLSRFAPSFRLLSSALPAMRRLNPIILGDKLPKSAAAAATYSNEAAPMTASSADGDQSQRDLVNFPRRKRPIARAPVRLGFLPEEWFTFFHEKTGATGPYVFIVTVGSYLLSKEIWILDHEFYVGIALIITWGGIYHYMGDEAARVINAEMDRVEKKLKAIRQDEIDRCEAALKGEEEGQMMASSYEQLLQVKRENVALQLEMVYRERLHYAAEAVRKRLDFQAELANVMRRAEQRHMVQWIIEEVREAITEEMEEEALMRCVQELRAMAEKEQEEEE